MDVCCSVVTRRGGGRRERRGGRREGGERGSVEARKDRVPEEKRA